MPYDTDKFPVEVVKMDETSGYESDVEVKAPTVSCSSYACLGASLVANDVIQCSGDSACYGSMTKINDKNGEIICGGSIVNLSPFVSTADGWVKSVLDSFNDNTCANDDVSTTTLATDYKNALEKFDEMLRGPMDTGTPEVVAAAAIAADQSTCTAA